MTKFLWIVAFIVLIFAAVTVVVSAEVEDIDACPSIDACLQRIYAVAQLPESQGSDLSEQGWAIAKRMSQFGDEAVVYLLPLLKDRNANVAQIASAALRDTAKIDVKYLPQIIEALDSGRDLPWLPPALGRIDSPLAAEEAVRRFIKSKDAPFNQEALAVSLSGQRAIPFIIKAVSDGSARGRRSYYKLGHVLREMDAPSKVAAARELMRAATVENISVEAQAGLIYLISFLGEAGMTVEQDLIAFKTKHKRQAKIVEQVLIEIKSKHAGAIFASRLSVQPDVMTLRRLAGLGRAGIEAGPIVMALLDHSNWGIRLSAARALGYIEYAPSVPSLIPLVNEPADVRLNWVAAWSLGRLADRGAETVLRQASESHWHVFVREAALQAVEALAAEGNQPPRVSSKYASGYIMYLGTGIKSCEQTALKKLPEPLDTKLYIEHAQEQLETLTYKTEISGVGAADEAEQLAADPDAIIEIWPDNMVVHRRPIDHVPHVALRTDHGWLAGGRRGEWGGELVYIAEGKQPVIILRDNIEDIYQLDGRYVAVAGLAHLGMNQGMLYELTFSIKNGWRPQRWRALPGAPQSSWIVETGELLVNTSEGGSILIAPDGTMRMAPCL